MFRALPVVALVGCAGAIGIDEARFSQDLDNPWAEPVVQGVDPAEDLARYEGAKLRIQSPGSGAFLPLEAVHSFEATLVDAEGEEIPYDDIAWTSDVDAGWFRAGARFEDNGLDVGIHALTAEAELPNGDSLAHTIGGVLIQSRYAGTYAGLFSVDVDYNDLTVTCVGSSLIVIDPYGEVAAGEGDCLVSLLGIDLPLRFLFDLEHEDGELEGVAGADVFGWFTFDFDAEGTVNPSGEGIALTFGGDATIVDLDATLGAERISLDSGL